MMKRTFIIQLLCIIQFSFANAQNEITISGTIKNTEDINIAFTAPINGMFFPKSNYYTTIDTVTNHFSITIPLTKAGFVVASNNWNLVKIFAEPGKKYIWNGTFEKDKLQSSWDGDNKEGNDALNSIGQTPDGKAFSKRLSGLNTVKQKNTFLDSLISAKKETFEKLLKEKKIDQAFYNAVENEFDVWKRAVLSTSYYFVFRASEDGRDKEKYEAFKKDVLPDWQKITNGIGSNLLWTQSTNFSELLMRYQGLKEIENTGTLDFGSSGKVEPLNRTAYTGFKNEILEYALAFDINMESSRDDYNISTVDHFDEYKSDFPNSPFVPELQSIADKIRVFHENIATSGELQFLPNYEKINTHEELFQALKGDKVSYVDMWASWCVPCRKEMAISINNHEQYEKIGVNLVYLSIDTEADKGKWLKMAKGLKIPGINLLANESLSDDLSKTAPNFNGIPRYIILSPDGKVLDWDAKRPSDELALFKDLQKYVSEYAK